MKILIRILTLSLALASSLALRAETIRVVVNIDSPVVILDERSVKRIFLGKTVKLPDGASLTPVDIHEDDALFERFYANVVKKTSQQLASYWSRQLFSGKGTPPQQVETQAIMLELIGNNAEYIGYTTEEVDTSKVKVVYSIEL